MVAVIVVLVLAVAIVLAQVVIRRSKRGDEYPDVPSVGRSEAEERRDHQGGLASLEDMSGAAGPVSPEYWAAKKFDDETRHRGE